MDMRIPPLKSNITLESNPLKSNVSREIGRMQNSSTYSVRGVYIYIYIYIHTYTYIHIHIHLANTRVSDSFSLAKHRRVSQLIPYVPQ